MSNNEDDLKQLGKADSYWIDSTPSTDFSLLNNGLEVDVAILGGGIVGITTAIMLKKLGKSVAIIEANRIVKDITSTTTAKISAHTFFYNTLLSKLGKEKTKLFANANMQAVEIVSNIITENYIECDFKRTPCFIYTESDDEIDFFKKDAVLASELELPVSYCEDIPISNNFKSGIVYKNQAEFHPRKYLLALSKKIPGEGSYVFEKTRALKIRKDSKYEVLTDQGSLNADKVVVATHFPIYDPDDLYKQMKITRSYILACYLNESFPEGMFVCTKPFHTYRSTRTKKGQLIIVAGEHQVVGTPIDTVKCYKHLEEHIQDNWDLKSIDYHWCNQDNGTPDGLPIIGETSENGIYVATGFGGWGMTHGTTAAMLITDLIMGKENPLTDLFSPLRFKDSNPIKPSDNGNVETAQRFKNNKITWPDNIEIPDLKPGEAVIISEGSNKFSIYKDEFGELHKLQGVCNHMGCTLVWNNAEKTWDCPCHGSRYDCLGKVIHAPALEDLKSYDI